MRTVIYGGTLARHTDVISADIAFENGRIVAVGSSLPRENAHCIDATDCIVMPGGVDMRVRFTAQHHAADAVYTVADDWYTGSVAAVCGGTTCVIAQPALDACGGADAVTQERSLAQEAAVVDYGIHGVFTPQVHEKTLAKICKQGVGSAILSMYGNASLTDAQILSFLALAKLHDCLAVAHCQNQAMLLWLAKGMSDKGCVSVEHITAAFPVLSEIESLGRMLALAYTVDAPVYLASVASAQAVHLVRGAQRQRKGIVADTCPHYLLLDAHCYEEGPAEGLKYAVTPPLQQSVDAARLWEALYDGSLCVVASDHCAYSYADKWQASQGNVFLCPQGMPGVETRIPLLFSEGVLKGRLTLPRFVSVVAHAPAQLLGLPQKGVLEAGADADIVVLDPACARDVSAAQLHSSADYTPYEGMHVRGWPRHVWLRGQEVVVDGAFVGTRGCGNFVATKASW